jgi:tetratricopeptide (TPR) repeat protein
LSARGYEARGEKRLADAKNCFAQAVDRCRKANDRLLLAQALSGLGQIEMDMGNAALALRHYGDAVDLRRTQGDPQAAGARFRHVADIHREQGQPVKAAPCYEEALALYRKPEQTRPLDLANAIRGYALADGRSSGDQEEANFFGMKRMALYAESGVRRVSPKPVADCVLMGR